MQAFFACGSSAPVRVEREGGAAVWLVGTLAAQSVQAHEMPSLQELWPYQSIFLSLLYLEIRRPLWPVFVHSSTHSGTYRGPSLLFPHQAHRGAPLTEVLLCSLAHQSLKGAPWVGSYSVVQCDRHLMGQPLYCSAANAGLCVVAGERLW